MKKVNKSLIIFIAAISIITIARYILVRDLPILANAILGADDALMIGQAATIINGQWLGPYNATTLLKGVAFPLFLSFCYFFNIKYISGITIIYIIGCLTFILVIKKLIKNKLILFLIYTLLLFNPIMFGREIMQRVYRSSIIPGLAIFIISCYINLFFLKNTSKRKIEKVLTIIGISITLPFLWYAREDSIWIIPYIIFISTSILISVIVKNKKINKEFWKVFVFLLIPVVITFAIENLISLKNYKEYNIYTTNNKYYYNKTIDSMKKVKANREIDRVSFSREKLNRIANVTILGTIMEEFNPLLDAYAKFDGNQEDNEVENGWFGFPLREALANAGFYKNANTTNAFFYTLHLQIEEALKTGKLEQEKQNYDYKFLKNMVNTVYRCTKYILNYDEIILDVTLSREYVPNLCETFNNYSKITGNKFIYTKSEDITNENTIVNFDEQDKYLDSIKNENNIINNIIELYKKITTPIFVIAIIFYFYSTMKLIFYIKNKEYSKIENWVILSGILGAAFTIICGISLETVLNADVISDLYLCGVYPLILAFTLISVYNGCVEIITKIKTRIIYINKNIK